MKTFLVTYGHGGDRFSLELQATDVDDAKARLSNLVFGQVQGEVMARLPASTGALSKLYCYVRNALA